MIGLGSNRLSVCRRGGMSVTQAGRGGMEWLAGGRMPSWASPYSAQATAALKDAFSAAQWATIRDYGFAHPALVPFINEDPMLVMSLIEGLGTRWLIGDGNCYVTTDYIPQADDLFHSKIKINPNVTWDYMVPFGCRDYATLGQNSRFNFFITPGRKFRIDWACSNTNQEASLTLATDTEYNIEIKKGLFKVNGTTYYNNSSIQGVSPLVGMRIFGSNETGDSSPYPANIRLTDVTCDGKISCVPFHGRTLGYGMVDIVRAKFFAKQGSGSFTISETPASQTP